MKRLNLVIAVFHFKTTYGLFAQNKTQKIEKVLQENILDPLDIGIEILQLLQDNN